MSKRIFIDSLREGNYAIAIVDKSGNLEEFNFENQGKKTIKSNIYLGKVIRVEHSLQAAFVEYGENRAGFLPFSEIHPDYYQVPLFDREKMKQNLRQEEKDKMLESEKAIHSENDEEDESDNDTDSQDHYYALYKKYNIQEVVKRGQNVLVQVFRDERGNKGASLTTYISLAGRYCVLMPNSPRGIGISKKIFPYEKRRLILNIVKKFGIAYGTGLVVRTAGVSASEKDLKRDYEYLVELWNSIRAKAVKAQVQSLVHEEHNIVEQTIRDNYDENAISAIIVSGKKCFNSVHDFIKRLIPGEESKVRFYSDRISLFKKYGIEQKLHELLHERVELKSGGYLIINQTEALVAIDVNSGKSTHEKNVEETALKTNLEAASEIARQLRLRNLGGLIVVDFIDMIELKNKKAVEKELKGVFMSDKAKVQFTRISIFGLVEISRQRLRSSLSEMMTVPCDSCHGTGRIKSFGIIAVNILDALVETLQNPKQTKRPVIEITCIKKIADCLISLHINEINDIEKKFNVKIVITQDHFAHNEHFLIKTLNEIGKLETATQLYDSFIKLQASKATSKRRWPHTLLTKIYSKLKK
jgi:ribonuclease E